VSGVRRRASLHVPIDASSARLRVVDADPITDAQRHRTDRHEAVAAHDATSCMRRSSRTTNAIDVPPGEQAKKNGRTRRPFFSGGDDQ